MDIGGWLRSLGLGEYEAIFCENKIENKIDETVLPKLTTDDLKDLGTARSVIATPTLTEG
jgi:hypothetical protein